MINCNDNYTNTNKDLSIYLSMFKFSIRKFNIENLYSHVILKLELKLIKIF